MSHRILIACVGNIFLGDDGFGVEVARRLMGRLNPPEVTVKDFGIRGFDLAYALMEPYALAIVVDACARGGEPGTVYLIEPDPAEDDSTPSGLRQLEPHGMNPVNVLRLVKSLGGAAGRVLIVGCEPAELGSDSDGCIGLSEPVHAAIEEAVSLIDSLVSRALDGEAVQING